MRRGVPYEGDEMRLYEEAIRMVPAFIKQKMISNPKQAFYLLDAYMKEAADLQISIDAAWSILFVAATAYLHDFYNDEADLLGLPVTAVLDKAIAGAVTWVSQ